MLSRKFHRLGLPLRTSCANSTASCNARDSPASLHIVLALLLIELSLLFGSRVLVLLVFGDQVVHVALGLCELHLVHTLTGVPVQECLPAKHCCEVLGDTLEHLLDRSGVAQESDCHLQALWRNVADSALHVVRDPFDEVRRVL